MTDDVVDPFDGEVLDLVVPSTLGRIRVDRVLAMLTGLSRSETSQIVASGSVTLDGKVLTKTSTPVEEGQRLVAVVPARASGFVEADSSVPVTVVLEDRDFVVVDKMAGQVVHPGAGHLHGTLIAGLLARYPDIAELGVDGVCDPARPGVVHRLDKGTSGLLVVARTREGFASLSSQLAERTMERIYLGLVEGHISEERGVVDAPIGRSTRTPTLMAVRADGRPARTTYEVLARIDKPHATTLLRLRLETGRTHQIRVHMATIGHPVVNDPRYGHRRDRRLAQDRFFLHSRTLAFSHPRSAQRVTAQSPLPADLAAMVPEGVER
ncbi:MAG TPA: RluA family pseudouridine synthase [Acidimicrobiales bacterium]|nr:RluA family pseudouridine synthase [Acidimicrobiales bacterium]